MPEGFEANETVMGEAQTLFKELNLTQDQAQKLVDFYAKSNEDAANAPFKVWADTQKEWKDQLKADPEIGGKLPEVKRTVARAIDSLGDPKLSESFREAMDVTGAGNHPAFVKAMYVLAQRITEGTHVAGNGPAKSKPASAASAMYPNLPSQG